MDRRRSRHIDRLPGRFWSRSARARPAGRRRGENYAEFARFAFLQSNPVGEERPELGGRKAEKGESEKEKTFGLAWNSRHARIEDLMGREFPAIGDRRQFHFQ